MKVILIILLIVIAFATGKMSRGRMESKIERKIIDLPTEQLLRWAFVSGTSTGQKLAYKRATGELDLELYKTILATGFVLFEKETEDRGYLFESKGG